MMRVTVATTTRNRRDAVLRLLDSVTPQLEDGDEVIVVDNGSVDGTGDAIREWMHSRRASITLIAEPDGGTSLARNRVLAAATNPVVCFVDDDATADAGWLDSLRAAWQSSSQMTAGVGGPIRPDWNGGERPP
jgi:glycosyltransferase involved in cell wall biosynthesis